MSFNFMAAITICSDFGDQEDICTYFYTVRDTDDTTLTAESEELKSFLMEVKEESEEVALKLSIQKT